MNKEERYVVMSGMLEKLEKIRKLKKEIFADCLTLKNTAWKNELVAEDLGFTDHGLKTLTDTRLKWICDEHQMSHSKLVKMATQKGQIPSQEELYQEYREMVDEVMVKIPKSNLIFQALEDGKHINEERHEGGFCYYIYENHKDECVCVDYESRLFYLLRFLENEDILNGSYSQYTKISRTFYLNKKIYNKLKKTSVSKTEKGK